MSLPLNAHMILTKPTAQGTPFTLLGLFLGSLFLFTFGLATQEIIGFDSRFYLFAQEMWRHGLTWFPTTYGGPYADYPATSTVLIYLAAKGWGGLNKGVAVLPTAIAASLTITLTYCIGALQNKRWGWYAALLMLLTVAFIKSARSLSLDMYTTLITTTCFYLVCLATACRPDKRSPYTWSLYALLFLAFAFRGPIGLVMPTGVICTYYLLDGKLRQGIITGLLALALLVVSTLALLALAYYVGGSEFLHDVLRMEVLGRMDTSYLPPYFYLTDGMLNYALSFPLACLVALGLGYQVINRQPLSAEKKQAIKLLGWMAIILLGMSIPGDKKIRYILPMVPAAALLAAYPFVAPAKERYFVYLRRAMLTLFALLPLLFSLTLALLMTYANNKARSFSIDYLPIFVFLGVMQVLNVMAFYYTFRHEMRRITLILLTTVASVAVVNMSIVEPVELNIDSAKSVVQAVERQRLSEHASLVFYRERPDSLPIKYLINMSHAESPLFLDKQTELLGFPKPAFFVTSQHYFDELPHDVVAHFRIIAKDTLGHVKVVVFTQH
jgi:4-amino-4-deoxy-L-arabinose transferase-like glycosyltransferase